MLWLEKKMLGSCFVVLLYVLRCTNHYWLDSQTLLLLTRARKILDRSNLDSSLDVENGGLPSHRGQNLEEELAP